ncbi:hypothetical protein ABER61_26575 [Brevibacillus formosus]|uniref:DUF3951 domain-containing protein n=1 Tax=Brevibacillus formosus TaxID=54913 RepID=A0A837KJ95_9BACL|nr:hypothetical protein [Brevibacillus formosus]KLH96586.1 hypothetical protein AA984_24055 [Brevibacillus formosus]MED1960277.1 hypothetical protein [Brevibacillus formosus]PSJ93772.1 hypothetical protein C7R91_19525 [Brevibacillus formosus]GED59609.1 hypothetical protein BFO01nite_37410 [Brevibacillus formosus]
MTQMIVVLIIFTFVVLIARIVFRSIKEKRLPNPPNYTPYDDVMSGKVRSDETREANKEN